MIRCNREPLEFHHRRRTNYSKLLSFQRFVSLDPPIAPSTISAFPRLPASATQCNSDRLPREADIDGVGPVVLHRSSRPKPSASRYQCPFRESLYWIATTPRRSTSSSPSGLPRQREVSWVRFWFVSRACLRSPSKRNLTRCRRKPRSLATTRSLDSCTLCSRA